MTTKVTPLKHVVTKTLDTTLADSPAIDIRSYVCGGIFIEATHASVTLVWYASPTVDGTYLIVNDSTGTTVAQTVADPECVPIPKEVFVFPFMKCVPNADDGEEFTFTLCSVAPGE